MTVSMAFLGVSLVGALFTLNAFVPVRHLPVLFIPSFFGSWVTVELAAHHVAWQAVATVVFVALGALDAWPGWVGLGITLASWVGLAVLFSSGSRAHHVYDEVLAALPSPAVTHPVPWLQRVVPFAYRRPHVKVTRHVPFAEVDGTELHLDVVAPSTFAEGRPAILQVHGGAWIIGDKREQGLALMGHLAANGWVCFNANYRLSPKATFPEHLIDLKRALAWIRDHAEEYGVDPSFVAVTGGSAGGHLASLLALTWDDARYQPGFEGADTSVQAAVPIYGVYDFTNRTGEHRPSFVKGLLEPVVMKAKIDEEPEKFRDASPVDRVRPDAPPFFVIHGDHDSLSPVAGARLFVDRLGDVSEEPVLYAELRGAQHAFDVFCTPRTARTVEAVHRFLEAELERHRERD
ncbi:MAG TPA: alpha/beta hydrolase [Sandaracinaceae bacterium LLY-WYZ-13_1]|nr:alpha/beta hydrolase [Sandaracinaceae bacterium LLY-WYZ-13_1]